MTPFVLPLSWASLLVVDDDPMSGGIARHTVPIRHPCNHEDALWLRVVAPCGKRAAHALLCRRVTTGTTEVDGRKCSLVDNYEARITGCPDEATAIRAVEEAAIIAGWCARRT